MTRAEQVLQLDDVTLSDGAGVVVHAGGFTLETLSADASFGHAEPLRVSLATGLLDGEVVEVTGYGNREDLYFQVRVRAADAEGLAQGGKLLEENTGRPGELKWTPPAPFGQTTVYDVATSDLEWLFDDMDETPQGQRMPMRVYGLRIEAHPFGRPVEPVRVAAAESGEATPEVRVVIDDGTSTSGWSAMRGSTPLTVTASAGGVGVEVPAIRTNLVPNGNFQMTPVPWVAAAGSASVSRVASFGGRTGGVLRVTPTGWGTIPTGNKFSHAYMGSAVPVTAGQRYDVRYKYRFEFAPNVGSMPAGFLYRWRNASGAQVGTDQVHTATAFTGTSWRDVAVKLPAAPAGATQLQVYPRVGRGENVISSGSWYIDDFMIATSTNGSTVDPYFDGDTPIAGGIAHGWSGTRYNSTSVARAVGPVTLTRTGAVDFSDTPYLHVDHAAFESATTVTADGVPLTRVAGPALLGVAQWRTVFAAPEGVVNELSIEVGSPTAMAPAVLYAMELVRTTSGSGLSSTGRQLARAFPVHGTRRTTGSLHISHQDPIGPAVIYCTADDGSNYQPSTRTYKTSGAPDIPASDSMTGVTTSLSEPYEVQIPRSVLPAGVCSIWGRLVAEPSATRVSLSVEVQPIGGAITMPTKTLAASLNATAGLASLQFLGRMSVAKLAAEGDVWKQRIRLTRLSPMALDIDDLYVFNHTTGSLVIVEDVPTRNLWIDAPTIQAPFPKMYAGNEPDRSDAAPIGSLAKRWDVLGMPPGLMNIFTALGVPNGAVAAEYFPRVGHNVSAIEGAA